MLGLAPNSYQQMEKKNKKLFWNVIFFLLIALIGFLSIRTIFKSKKELEYDLARLNNTIEPKIMSEERLNLKESTQPNLTTPQIYKLGNEINLEDRIIIIYGFSSYSHKFMKDYYGISKGVAMEVELRNISNKELEYSPLDFEVKNSKGEPFIFYDMTPGGKKPVLWFGNLLPQETIRAFITYATNDEPYTISYKPLKGPKFFTRLE